MDDIDNLLNGDDINDIPLDLDINFGTSALVMQDVEEEEEDDEDGIFLTFIVYKISNNFC